MLETPINPPPRWELYRVLSEPLRLRLLALAAEEELAIGELAELLGESQPNVSRHASPLRQAALLAVRKEGTRTLVRLQPDALLDPVVADALQSGRLLCRADGSLSRIADVLRLRDSVTREFFARPPRDEGPAFPPEFAAYLSAIAPLVEHRGLAVDAGTGDGGLLEVLSPIFDRVVAVDRSGAQIERARQRASSRGLGNVDLVGAELSSAEVRAAVGEGADAVFASRILHHAPKPAAVVGELAALCRPPGETHPGGVLVLVDYDAHDDEAMRAQADLWLGFEAAELRRFARAAGLGEPVVTPIPRARCGRGPDAHLPWLVMVARRESP